MIRRLFIRHLLVVFLVPLMAAHSYAQRYPFKSYSTADGLVQASLAKIFQDSRGFIWFGTGGGLSRYDGVGFTNFLSSGRELSFAIDIVEDPDGTMWIATYGNGVAVLRRDDTTFTWIRSADGVIPDDRVHAIARDRNGSIWVGTLTGIVVLRKDGSVAYLDKKRGLPHNTVRTIAEHPDGTIWIGTQGGLVKCRNDGTYKMELISDQHIRSLLVTRDGDVYAGSRWGNVYRYRSGAFETIVRNPNVRGGPRVESLCEDLRGRVWAATTNGILLIDRDRITRIGVENGLRSEFTTEVMEDREGTMWIGTGDGVMKLAYQRLSSFYKEQGLSSQIIIAMCHDSRQQLWLGTYSGLVRLGSDGRMVTLRESDGLRHSVVFCVEEDHDQRIWVGTAGGLNVISNGKVSGLDFAGIGQVGAIARDPDGGMWVGTEGRILKIARGRVVIVLDSISGVPSAFVRSLLVDREGRTWFGTSDSGAGYYSQGRIVRLTMRDGLPDPRVTSIAQDGRERIWLTTYKGVALWNGVSLERLTLPAPAFQNGAVSCVVEDNSGHLWFGTQYGIYEWADSLIQHLGTQDGLAADVVRCGDRDAEGNLWFGTHNGVSRLELRGHYRQIPVPQAYIERASAGDGEVPVENEAQVDHTNRTLLFRFNALSFVDERNMLFQWMLEGFDRDWFHPERHRQARYTNLIPGKYAFLVRAANRNGPWSEPVRFTFAILPPFWQTWWFILLSSGTVITLGTLLYKYRVNQLLRIERMRTRIATDLHDDIGASLSRIALFSEVAKEEAKGSSPRLFEMSQKIGDNARELLDAVGTLVWSIDPRHDRFDDVITQMKNFAQEMFTAKGIDYRLQIEPALTKLRLPLDMRKNLLLIFKEAVTNVVRHAECRSVEIVLAKTDGLLEMKIEDDGKGLDPQLDRGGHGLANMKLRARSMNAQFSVASRNGKGTTVLLRLSLT